MNSTIQFASTNTTTESNTTPWEAPKRNTYQDLLLKPEYEERRLRLPIGQTWLRIVPAIAGSAFEWIFPIHVNNFEGGRFAHPKTLKKNARSAFDHAYAWIKLKSPESLYSKGNKAGVRLLTDPMCVFWALHEEEGRAVSRLFLASGYDGSRGGVPGLGYQIWKLSREKNEQGEIITDAVDPEKGVQLCIEKTHPKGAQYPSYGLRLGRVPAPINELIAKMDTKELSALTPLENVVRELSEQEQWECLGKVIAPDTAEIIWESLKH